MRVGDSASHIAAAAQSALDADAGRQTQQLIDDAHLSPVVPYSLTFSLLIEVQTAN